MKEIVIPKEKAVFWMDGNGRWHNQHGPFRHKKLIAYFNAAIGWDAAGFFVGQERGEFREKVYFRCEETALFAVDALSGSGQTILLNTRQRVALEPQKLFVRNDHLFMTYQDTLIKFTDRCMMQLAGSIEEVDEIFYFTSGGKRYRLPSA